MLQNRRNIDNFDFVLVNIDIYIDNFEDFCVSFYLGFVPDDILYPEIKPDLKKWLESRQGSSPIVYVSLGTVLKITSDEMQAMMTSMQNQQNYYFVWAVRKSVFEEMGYSEPSMFLFGSSKNLFFISLLVRPCSFPDPIYYITLSREDCFPVNQKKGALDVHE